MNSRTPVHITQGASKMINIPSVNVSSLQSPYCIKQSSKPGSVCQACYSNRYSRLRPTLDKKLFQNSHLLSQRILDKSEVPLFNNRYVRFNSFGEILNETHYLNLIQIAHNNPHTIFGLWSKRYDIVEQYPKEPNIRYILSCETIDPTEVVLRPYWDKIFVVQTSEEGINCNKACIDCLLCYEKNNVTVIKTKKK